jgi:tetratricopeptide (TPR) repeat protein
MRRLLSLALFPIILIGGLTGQRRPGDRVIPRQYADVSVVVRTQGGTPVAGVQVELLDASGLTVNRAFTNDNGEARIAGVPTGATYVLRLSGENIVPARQEMYMEPGEGEHTEWIDVEPRTIASVGASPPSVAVVDLNVPDKARKELEAGNSLAKQEKWEEAAKHYQKAIELYPKYATAFNNLGSARMNLHDVAGAKEAYRQAVEINDKYGGAWLNLAKIQYAAKDYTGAEQDLLKVIVTDPKNVQALVSLAQTDLQLAKYDDAEQYVKKVDASPHAGFAIVHVIGAYAYQNQNKAAEALAEYKKYLDEDPNGALAAKVKATIEKLEAQKTNP